MFTECLQRRMEDILANWAFKVFFDFLRELKFMALFNPIGVQTVHFQLFNFSCHSVCSILDVLRCFLCFLHGFKILLTLFNCFWSTSFLFFLDKTACNMVSICVNMPKDRSLYSCWREVTVVGEWSGMNFRVFAYRLKPWFLHRSLKNQAKCMTWTCLVLVICRDTPSPDILCLLIGKPSEVCCRI